MLRQLETDGFSRQSALRRSKAGVREFFAKESA
jgi:hypothetical protein